jgi:glutamate dehydrogenase/leucine dehydrogenase
MSAPCRPTCSRRQARRSSAVSDWKGGVYNDKGLDIPKMIETPSSTEHRRLPRRRADRQRELFSLDVDILIPAALENQITLENAPKIKAKIIAGRGEQPHHPRGPQEPARARRLRHPRHPREPGGVTTSYFEWVQDRYRYSGKRKR